MNATATATAANFREMREMELDMRTFRGEARAAARQAFYAAWNELGPRAREQYVAYSRQR